MLLRTGNPALDVIEYGVVCTQVRFLLQILNGQPWLHEALTTVCYDQPGGNLQKRRLSRAVTANQPDAITAPDLQIRARHQRRATKREVDVLQCQNWRRHRGNLL